MLTSNRWVCPASERGRPMGRPLMLSDDEERPRPRSFLIEWSALRLRTEAIIKIDGGAADCNDRSKGVNGRVLNTITPETNTTCMYFWSLVRN